MHRWHWPPLLLVTALGAAACDRDTTTTVAPSATALEDTRPKAAGAVELAIVGDRGEVTFELDAPQEKIRGRVERSITGTLAVDATDLTKTTGHLYVDIGGLELFQQKAGDDGAFGPEEKSELQNEHARDWLEIGSCDKDGVEDKAQCEKMTKENRKVELVVTKVEATPSDLTELSGPQRKVTATVTGDFLLHQHKTAKTAKVELIFDMDGDAITGLRVKTVEPFAVGLAEHDVRPREAFGRIAQKTLDVLAPKVAKEALVGVTFEAKPGTAKAAVAPKEPDSKEE